MRFEQLFENKKIEFREKIKEYFSSDDKVKSKIIQEFLQYFKTLNNRYDIIQKINSQYYVYSCLIHFTEFAEKNYNFRGPYVLFDHEEKIELDGILKTAIRTLENY